MILQDDFAAIALLIPVPAVFSGRSAGSGAPLWAQVPIGDPEEDDGFEDDDEDEDDEEEEDEEPWQARGVRARRGNALRGAVARGLPPRL